jgi:hypothetical protein
MAAQEKVNKFSDDLQKAKLHLEHVDDNAYGENADLDEHGYQQIVALQDDSEMEDFISRVIFVHDAHVVDKKHVTALAPYYSGTKRVQTFAALVKELTGLTWATGFTENATNGEADAYTRMAFRVYQKKEALATALIKNGEITGETAAVTGSDAHLDEAGYQAVAKLKSNDEMKKFIKRVVSAHHATIADEGRLQDFAKFYGSENRQRLSYMENALNGSPWIHGWAAEMN